MCQPACQSKQEEQEYAAPRDTVVLVRGDHRHAARTLHRVRTAANLVQACRVRAHLALFRGTDTNAGPPRLSPAENTHVHDGKETDGGPYFAMTAPAGLFRELWVDEIIGRGLADMRCLTRHMLRLTCRWFYHHCPPPVHTQDAIERDFAGLVRLPGATQLLCVRLVPAGKPLWDLDVLYRSAQIDALREGNLAGFFVLRMISSPRDPVDKLMWDAALDSRRLAVVQGLWRLSEAAVTNRNDLWRVLDTLLNRAEEGQDRALYTWLMGGISTSTWRSLVYYDASWLEPWLQRAKQRCLSGDPFWLRGWLSVVKGTMETGYPKLPGEVGERYHYARGLLDAATAHV